MRQKYINIALGLVLVALGVLMACGVLGLIEFNIFFDGWWTLFIILPCLYSMGCSGFNWLNAAGVITGVLLLLDAQDILENGMALKLIIPVIVIGCGLSVLFMGRIRHNSTVCRATGADGAYQCTAIFGEQNLRPDAHQPFKGADAVTIFGGINIDLREALIEEDVVINVTTVFGGIEIYPPANVRAVSNIAGILGGADNKFRPALEPEHTIYINGVCVFGGADIK